MYWRSDVVGRQEWEPHQTALIGGMPVRGQGRSLVRTTLLMFQGTTPRFLQLDFICQREAAQCRAAHELVAVLMGTTEAAASGAGTDLAQQSAKAAVSTTNGAGASHTRAPRRPIELDVHRVSCLAAPVILYVLALL
jgi:hypothetical protein